MGDILDKSPQDIISTIRESNEKSKVGTQRYLFGENKAIQADFEFINCGCTEDCWCKKNGCTGHYRIREILTNFLKLIFFFGFRQMHGIMLRKLC